MSYMNRKLDSSIETMFIPASEESHFISSRFVKQLAKLEGNLSSFVSKNVEQQLKSRFENE